MSLPAYLANIKSSGIYRFVWDKSEIPNTTAEILRLVVGYSERGPFNTPVYVQSQTEFRSIFGGISKKLERQGCFFHRLALQALRKGPILCLNLKNFQNETVEAVNFDPQDTMSKINLAVQDIYNTNRFWTLEPEQLEELDLTKSKYITITSTDTKETSNTIFIRGYEPAGYNVTFKEWFSSTLNGAEMPSYLEGFENKKLQNYWAEIYVFRGEFTKDIATSDVLAKYFDVDGDDIKLKPYIENAFGEKKDTLDALANNDASNFIRKYQGILLPEFQSANGSTISLDILFNNDNQLHKMMMRLNQTALYEENITLDDLDTTGWNLTEGSITYATGTNNVVYNITPNDVMSIQGNIPVIYQADFNGFKWDYNIKDSFAEGIDVDGMNADFYTYNMAPLKEELFTVSSDGFTISTALNESSTSFTNGYPVFNNLNAIPFTSYVGENNAETHIGKVAYLGEASGPIDTATENTDFFKMKCVDNDESSWIGLECYIKQADLANAVSNNTPVDLYYYDNNHFTKCTAGEDRFITVSVTASKFIKNGDVINQLGLAEGDIIWANGELCTIVKISYDTNINITFDKDVSDYADLLKGLFVKCAGSTTATSMNLVPTYVKGYVYNGAKLDQIADNTNVTDPQMRKNNWINYQLSILDSKGLRDGLTNRIDVEYRYLVDTFESYAVPGECKAKLALICKLKFNVLGLLNFPNMKSFAKCQSMSFKDSNGFDSKYIAMGGNPMFASGGTFKLASEDNGASFVSYNTPLLLKDAETGVKTAIPAAALVSNDFMDKFTKFLPYSIVAGVKRGMITDPDLIGPEFSFGRYDLDQLEPMGVNCMVYVPGKGTYINSNQTAKQNPVSALSKIHVRELCTFLQDEIEKMMEDYHWDFNTPNLRQTLKDRADVICDTCYRNGGIYAYYNVCDDSNNSPEIIDNEMVVLSTSIEPSRGAGKMIQELTLYRTGALQAAIKDAQ